MSGYTPLYDTMLTGTLFGRWPHTGIWACMLSRASREGVIDEVPASLAAAIGVPVELLLTCINDFMQPDPGSRTKDHGGRRLALIDANRDWGWKVLNHGKYREKARKKNYDEIRTESGADAERKETERKSREVPARPAKSRAVPLSDAEALKSKSTPRKHSEAKSPIPDDFVLTPDRQAYAEKHLPDVDASTLMDVFRSTSKAKGWKYVDWEQHWQTLVRQWAPGSSHWSSGQYAKKNINGAQRHADGREIRW